MTDERLRAVEQSVAVLEERMKTDKAEHQTDIARLEAVMERNTRQTILAIASLVVAGVIVLGFLIRT